MADNLRDNNGLPIYRREFFLRIDIDGSSWERVAYELDRLSHHIVDHGPECNSVSGGVSCSHSVTIIHDPLRTEERFSRDMQEYRTRRQLGGDDG